MQGGVDEYWPLAGPRGRRLCWELLGGVHGWAAERGRTAAEAEQFAAALTPDVVVRSLHALDERRLIAAFADSVAWARYWQAPDDIDQALGNPDVASALRPVAATVSHAAPAWWGAPVDLDAQRAVTWMDPHFPPLSLDGAAGKLRQWEEAIQEDEQRKRPHDVRARYSGRWWSTPALCGLAKSTRALPGLGAVHLALVEDEMGWEEAFCQGLQPTRPPRVYELTGPVDWQGLVNRYSLEVTRSRRHDWWRATGVDGRWFIPDYLAASRDYDALHLSARGYLTTAGQPYPVDGGATLLAGWDPDVTYWLTDCLTAVGPATRWRREPGSATDWRATGAG